MMVHDKVYFLSEWTARSFFMSHDVRTSSDGRMGWWKFCNRPFHVYNIMWHINLSISKTSDWVIADYSTSQFTVWQSAWAKTISWSRTINSYFRYFHFVFDLFKLFAHTHNAIVYPTKHYFITWNGFLFGILKIEAVWASVRVCEMLLLKITTNYKSSSHDSHTNRRRYVCCWDRSGFLWWMVRLGTCHQRLIQEHLEEIVYFA